MSFSSRSKAAYWTVRAGLLRRGSLLQSYHEELRRIDQIVIHPDYVDKGFLNDIALLKLDKPLQFRYDLVLFRLLSHIHVAFIFALDSTASLSEQSVCRIPVTLSSAGTRNYAPRLGGANSTSTAEYSVSILFSAFFVHIH